MPDLKTKIDSKENGEMAETSMEEDEGQAMERRKSRDAAVMISSEDEEEAGVHVVRTGLYCQFYGTVLIGYPS